MLTTDVAIVGGGLAGSVAAAMLGRAGVSAVLIDPHDTFQYDFRCEKLDPSQLALLERTGFARDVAPVLTPANEVWIVRFGRLVRKRHHEQLAFDYQTLVNAFRRQVPPSVTCLRGKASEISTSGDRQEVVLSDGTQVSARLVVLATGLNNALRHSLGIDRRMLSPGHSVSVGFDLVPANGGAFPFPSLTYSPEHHTDAMSYLSLFRIGARMRGNLFLYRPVGDPWLQDVRLDPVPALKELMPRLENLIGPFAVSGDIRIRPVDLYAVEGHRQPGVVLVGDAFATSCPAAGSGLNKVLTDVVQLCREHVPAWLATPGMGVEKIDAFYDDPLKRAADMRSREKAFFLRTLSTAPGIRWRVQRLARCGAQVVFGTIEKVERRKLKAQVANDDAVTPRQVG